MSEAKIIFTGPVGAGKSTAISAISDTPASMTRLTVNERQDQRKIASGVAVDYGVMSLPGGEKIHLYGTPGRDNVDLIMDKLTSGGIGLILLLDNTREHPLQDMRFFLDVFSAFIRQTSVAIGITQMDICASPTIEEYSLELQALGINPAIFVVDARAKKDVSILVQALLYSLAPELADATRFHHPL